MSSIKF